MSIVECTLNTVPLGIIHKPSKTDSWIIEDPLSYTMMSERGYMAD